jgi:hypothetical protein
MAKALCSLFITGLGQIVKGEGKKGLFLMLLFYLALPAIIYLTLLLTGFIFPYLFGFIVIFAIILWGYSIFDALMDR